MAPSPLRGPVSVRASDKPTPAPARPPSPRHPGDDALPPYSPGGVPEPDEDEKGRPERLRPSYPPKKNP